MGAEGDQDVQLVCQAADAGEERLENQSNRRRPCAIRDKDQDAFAAIGFSRTQLGNDLRHLTGGDVAAGGLASDQGIGTTCVHAMKEHTTAKARGKLGLSLSKFLAGPGNFVK